MTNTQDDCRRAFEKWYNDFPVGGRAAKEGLAWTVWQAAWSTRQSAVGDVVESGKRALRFLEMKGYRRCDIAACNCPYWHGGNADERLKELHELMSENGYSPDAKTLYKAVEELIVKAQAHPVTPLNVEELVRRIQLRIENNEDENEGLHGLKGAFESGRSEGLDNAIALIRKWAEGGK